LKKVSSCYALLVDKWCSNFKSNSRR